MQPRMYSIYLFTATIPLEFDEHLAIYIPLGF
jgi:hypothetical protein